MEYVLTYSNYYLPLEREHKLFPGLKVTEYDKGILRCPRCNYPGSDIEHGKRRRCEKCDLLMEIWGNTLEISD